MWLNCGNCIIKLHHKAEMKEDSLLCMSKESGFWDRNCSWWRSLWKFMEMTTKDLEHNVNWVEKSSSRLQEMNSNFERSSTVGKTTVKRALHAPEKSVKGRVIRCGKLHCRLLFRNCPTHPNLQQPPSWSVSRHRDWDKILHRQKDFDLWRHRWCSNYFILETQCC